MTAEECRGQRRRFSCTINCLELNLIKSTAINIFFLAAGLIPLLSETLKSHSEFYVLFSSRAKAACHTDTSWVWKTSLGGTSPFPTLRTSVTGNKQLQPHTDTVQHK